MPDAVEGDFHVIDQVEYGPQQHDQTYPDKYAAFGLRQIGVDKLKDHFCCFRRTAEALDNLALHQIIKAEPACNGEYNRQNGDNGKQSAVCQSRCFVHKPVFGETVDAEVNGFDDII